MQFCIDFREIFSADAPWFWFTCTFPASANDFYLSRHRQFFFADIHTFFQFLDLFHCKLSFHSDKVGFIHMFSRCKEFMRQHTIICDKEQAFCIFIKSSYRKQTLAIRWNIFHNCSVITIFCCTDAAGWFIQKIIDKFRCCTYCFT